MNVATINSFKNVNKAAQGVESADKPGRKSVTITKEIPQFLDMVAAYQDKSRRQWPDLCGSALENAEHDERIKQLASLRRDNRDRALKLNDLLINSHRKTRIAFAKPIETAHRLIWMPENIHDGLEAKATACGVATYIFLQIYVTKSIFDDDPDFVNESLGNSLSGQLNTIEFWDDWLDDQIETQQEISSRILRKEQRVEQKSTINAV